MFNISLFLLIGHVWTFLISTIISLFSYRQQQQQQQQQLRRHVAESVIVQFLGEAITSICTHSVFDLLKDQTKIYNPDNTLVK